MSEKFDKPNNILKGKSKTIARYGCAAISGALLGALLSVVVNSVLVEISLNNFFSFYFGVIFAFVGVMMLWRINQHPTIERKALLTIFAIFVIASAILCIFFNKTWIFTLPTSARVPVYSLIAVSTSFAVSFAVVDLINLLVAQCNPNSPAVIESMLQVYILLGVSVLLGAVYGLMFGLMEVGKTAKTGYDLQRQLNKEEMFSLPFSIFLGGLAAVANELVRSRQAAASQTQYKYGPLFQNEDDDSMDI